MIETEKPRKKSDSTCKSSKWQTAFVSTKIAIKRIQWSLCILTSTILLTMANCVSFRPSLHGNKIKQKKIYLFIKNSYIISMEQQSQLVFPQTLDANNIHALCGALVAAELRVRISWRRAEEFQGKETMPNGIVTASKKRNNIKQ